MSEQIIEDSEYKAEDIKSYNLAYFIILLSTAARSPPDIFLCLSHWKASSFHSFILLGIQASEKHSLAHFFTFS